MPNDSLFCKDLSFQYNNIDKDKTKNKVDDALSTRRSKLLTILYLFVTTFDTFKELYLGDKDFADQ